MRYLVYFNMMQPDIFTSKALIIRMNKFSKRKVDVYYYFCCEVHKLIIISNVMIIISIE